MNRQNHNLEKDLEVLSIWGENYQGIFARRKIDM
jgi:hypothetical protein